MKISIEMFRVYGYLRTQSNSELDYDKFDEEHSMRAKAFYEDFKKKIFDEEGYKWHISDKYKIIMELPVDWILKEDANADINLIGFSPLYGDFDDFQENINISKKDLGNVSNLEIDELFEYFINQFSESLPSFDVLQKGLKRLDIYDGRYVIYNGLIGNVKVKNISFCFIDNTCNIFYTIHCNSKATDYDRYKPIFDRILKNINFFNF